MMVATHFVGEPLVSSVQFPYQWDSNITFLTLPIGFLLGTNTSLILLYLRNYTCNQIDSLSSDKAALLTIIVCCKIILGALAFWLCYLILGGEIVENYRHGSKNWSHDNLTYVLFSFLAYYTVSLIWTFSLIIVGKALHRNIKQ